MSHSPSDILAAARMQVYYRHPYLSTVLFALRPVEAKGLGTLAVDEGWRLYYDPETVVRWHEEQVGSLLNRVGGTGKKHDGLAAVVFHEMGHAMRDHATRRGDREPMRWNYGADRELNDDLVEAGWVLPCQPLLPSDLGMANGLTAEEYFRESTGLRCAVDIYPGGGQRCGGAAGNPTFWESEHADDADKPHPVDALEAEIVLRQTAEAIAKHVKEHGKGSVPLGLQVWSETKLEPARIDWRSRLAALTRGALASISGACDFTWRRTGRRSLHSAGRSGWPIAPALHQPVPKVGVVLDTSGSMSARSERGEEREVIQDALGEVVGIATAAGAGVTVYACDADVHASARIRSKKDVAAINQGGGGTDMRPGFLAAQKDKNDFVVIVTDGIVGSDWPSEEEVKKTKTLAVLVGEMEHPPSWIPFVEAK